MSTSYSALSSASEKEGCHSPAGLVRPAGSSASWVKTVEVPADARSAATPFPAAVVSRPGITCPLAAPALSTPSPATSPNRLPVRPIADASPPARSRLFCGGGLLASAWLAYLPVGTSVLADRHCVPDGLAFCAAVRRSRSALMVVLSCCSRCSMTATSSCIIAVAAEASLLVERMPSARCVAPNVPSPRSPAAPRARGGSKERRATSQNLSVSAERRDIFLIGKVGAERDLRLRLRRGLARRRGRHDAAHVDGALEVLAGRG